MDAVIGPVDPNLPRIHKLKIWPVFFEQVAAGIKRYEVRLADRVFCVGDVVDLQEWDPVKQAYTGSYALCRITCVTTSTDWEMIPNHLAIFGFTLHEVSRLREDVRTTTRFQ